MSWWQVVPEVLLLAVATVAWVREIRRQREKRAKVRASAEQNIKASAPQLFPTAIASMIASAPDLWNPVPVNVNTIAAWSALRLYPSTAVQFQSLTPLAASRWALSAGVPSRVTELESQLAELQQRLDLLEGRVAGLGDGRNVAAAPPRAREILSSVLRPIPAS